jgi:RNA polymerase sigma-70 factor (ECF subfamily)
MMARVHSPEQYADDPATGGSELPRQRIEPPPPAPSDRSDPSDPSDLSAEVIAAQGGDEQAYRTLFRAVQPGLLRYLRVLVGEDAEDVASETWLQIARDLGGFRGDFDGFRGWAATIGRNRAMDLLRSRSRRPRTGLPVEYLLDLAAADDTEGAALATVGTAQALALIAELPRDQAEAVLLRVVLDLDAAGAARVLGKRAGAVRMAAHRGLRRLAVLLDKPGTVPAPENSSAPGVTPARASTLKDMR